MYVCNLACVKLGMIFSGLLEENSFCEVYKCNETCKSLQNGIFVDQKTRVNMNVDDKAIIREIHSLTYLLSQ